MTIETCVAHAIHKDLEITKALPEVYDTEFDKIEELVESYIHNLQNKLSIEIRKREKLIDQPNLMASSLLESGFPLPDDMLLKMCETISNLSDMNAKFIADTPEGVSLYHIMIEITI